jgi:hypothetical protein
MYNEVVILVSFLERNFIFIRECKGRKIKRMDRELYKDLELSKVFNADFKDFVCEVV